MLTLVVSILSSGIALVYGIVAARWFGASGRGDVVAFMYWPALLGAIGPLGVPVAVGYYVAHEPDETGAVAGTGLAVAAALGFVASVISFAISPFALGDYSGEVLTAARIFSIIGLLIAATTAAHFPLRVMDRNVSWNILRGFTAAMPLVALIGVMVIDSRSLDRYSITLVAAQAVGMIAAVAVLARSTRLRFSKRWVKPLLRYGVPTMLSTLPLLLSVRLDQAFLIRETSRADLGNYAAAFAWSRAVPAATEFVVFMALPRLSALRGEERLREQDHLLRLAVLLTLAVAVPLALVSPFVVPLLFGEQFRLAGQLSLVLVPAAGVLGLASLSEEILRADRKLRTPIVAQLVGLVVAVGGLALAVPLVGTWGAALISLLTYVVVCGVLGVALRSLGLPLLSPFLLPRRRQFDAVLRPALAALRRLGIGAGKRPDPDA